MAHRKPQDDRESASFKLLADLPALDLREDDWLVFTPSRRDWPVALVRYLPDTTTLQRAFEQGQARHVESSTLPENAAMAALWGTSAAIADPSAPSAVDAFLEEILENPYLRRGHHEPHADCFLNRRWGLRTRLARQVHAVRRKLGPRICRRCLQPIEGRKANAGFCVSCKEVA